MDWININIGFETHTHQKEKMLTWIESDFYKILILTHRQARSTEQDAPDIFVRSMPLLYVIVYDKLLN